MYSIPRFGSRAYWQTIWVNQITAGGEFRPAPKIHFGYLYAQWKRQVNIVMLFTQYGWRGAAQIFRCRSD